MNEKTFNIFEVAQKQVDRAAETLDLDQPTRELLRVPMREYHFSIPIRMDDGEMHIFRGFRVQHNDARGPGKGGIRFHPLETIDTIRALAMWMTWKCAVADLPLGGSMGGVICDPHDLSLPEQERICRGWVRQIAYNVGPKWDVAATDLMSGPQHMLWMLDEYETIFGSRSPGFITGKPVELGGSLGRIEAAGYGVIIAVREALKDLALKPEKTTASVQGFGRVAQEAIRLYQRMGGTVVCISCWDQKDKTSYAFRKKSGISLDELLPATNSFGEIDRGKAEELGYECLPGEAWLEQDVDILLPAALENQITAETVKRINKHVKILAEGADGSTSPDADEIINARGVLIIPDLLANTGGVICDYFEQVQGNMNYYWKRDEVLGKMDVQMTSAYLSLNDFAHKNKMPLREAAYAVAVARVAQACRERGWV